MTTDTTTAEDRLAQARHSSAGCADAVWRVRACRSDGEPPLPERDARHLGPRGDGGWLVGKDLDVKAGREAAYTAALNVLALTRKQLGSLDRVSRVVRLGVYVAATPEFTEHPKVADAASELLRDVFGEETVSSAWSLVSPACHSVRRSSWKSSWK